MLEEHELKASENKTFRKTFWPV